VRVLPLAVVMFLALVPVTLVAPVLHELLVVRRGASPFAAHLFMSVNMMAGMLAAPIAARLAGGAPGPWLAGALALDALGFWLMGRAESLSALMVWRALEGAAHLAGVTLLMALASRIAGGHKGLVMGVMGASLTLGVGLGAPLGGFVGGREAALVLPAGAAIMLGAAAAALAFALGPAWRRPPDEPAAPAAAHVDRAAVAVPLAFAFTDRFAAGLMVSSFMLYAGQSLGFGPPARGMLMTLFMLPFALCCCPAGILADRVGRTTPLVVGAAGFGIVFASYGLVAAPLLPALMLASGSFSALKLAPALALCGDLAAAGRTGVFAAFNVAGSLGFLLGPLCGGLVAQWSLGRAGAVDYPAIFLLGGGLELLLALAVWRLLKRRAPAGRGAGALGAPIGSPAGR
jgi:MFS family permease